MNNKLLNEYLKIILSYVIIMSEYETISASNINYAIYKIDDWKNEYKINILGTSRELPLTQVTKKHMLKNMEQIRLSEFELPGKVINGMLALAMQLNPEIAKENIDELIKLEEKEFKMISEELDSLAFGGAGCTTMKYDCEIEQKNNPGKNAYSVSLVGLTGGHSGVNINRPHINAIEFLAQCTYDFARLNQIEFNISKFDGGPINNSLPVYAKIDLLMEPKQFEKFKRFAINQLILAKRVAQKQEEEAVLAFDKLDAPKKVYSEEDSMKILLFASLAPNKEFTQTLGENKMFSSSNLGFICIDDGRVRLDFKARSFIDGEVQRTVRKIKSLGLLLGFKECTQQGQLMAFINDIKHNTAAQI